VSKFAFRCRTCGNLEDSGNAGERDRPAACRVCGAGVSFDPKTGIKSFQDDNWDVLAELPPAELKPILDKHKLEPKDIGKHKPHAAAQAYRAPQDIERYAEDTVGVQDKAG
jgi:hypothetical protein